MIKIASNKQNIPLGNRQSAIGNRQSAIGNRQSCSKSRGDFELGSFGSPFQLTELSVGGNPKLQTPISNITVYTKDRVNYPLVKIQSSQEFPHKDAESLSTSFFLTKSRVTQYGRYRLFICLPLRAGLINSHDYLVASRSHGKRSFYEKHD